MFQHRVSKTSHFQRPIWMKPCAGGWVAALTSEVPMGSRLVPPQPFIHTTFGIQAVLIIFKNTGWFTFLSSRSHMWPPCNCFHTPSPGLYEWKYTRLAGSAGSSYREHIGSAQRTNHTSSLTSHVCASLRNALRSMMDSTQRVPPFTQNPPQTWLNYDIRHLWIFQHTFSYQSEVAALSGALNNIILAGNRRLLFPRITAVGGCWKWFEKQHLWCFLSFLKQDTEQEKVVRLSGVTANEIAAPSAGARIFHCY